MSSYRSGSSMDHRSAAEDDPPMSRLFVICNKSTTEDDFRDHFEQFGNIEDIWIVKDKKNGDNKGVAYIKYSKTSEAAVAQEEMNGKCIEDNQRPLKVLVASSRNSGSKRCENEQEKYLRLFIVINKNMTENDLKIEFSNFGKLDSISIVKDRNTGQPKFAYIKYIKFSHAAQAFENCDVKYKAVFAEPKSSSKMQDRDNCSRHDDFYNNPKGSSSSNGGPFGGGGGNNSSFCNEMSGFLQMQNSVNQPTCLEVICSASVNQDQLWRLFDIVPGLDYCHITRERGPRNNEVTVVYTNCDAAIYAKEKLHGLEYPPGERLIVKMSSVDANNDTRFVDHQLQKDSICNVRLPPAAPMANSDSHCARRCFIVLSSGLPITILKSVFCTFGGLIDVYLLPNKNCGYVKYTSDKSAQMAIETLNGAEVCGVRLKVMTAEEPKYPAKRLRTE